MRKFPAPGGGELFSAGFFSFPLGLPGDGSSAQTFPGCCRYFKTVVRIIFVPKPLPELVEGTQASASSALERVRRYFHKPIWINVHHRCGFIAGNLGVGVEAGMDVTVEQVTRPRPFHQCQKYLKPGVCPVR